jgi:hypothetical protein
MLCLHVTDSHVICFAKQSAGRHGRVHTSGKRGGRHRNPIKFFRQPRARSTLSRHRHQQLLHRQGEVAALFSRL